MQTSAEIIMCALSGVERHGIANVRRARGNASPVHGTGGAITAISKDGDLSIFI